METSHQAIIFNVQRFSIHDGPGIRTTLFFKGCPLRCKWCQNPESLSPHPELAFYVDRCRSTGDCLEVCPRQALRAGEERVDRELCDGCGLCVERCPYGALQLVGRKVGLEELLEQLLRDLPFYRSSDGGVTLSGGEPTLQLDFAVELARRLGDAKVGVVLQSCGGFAWDKVAPHLHLFELIQLDLKLFDRELHREHTGADNRVILENARRLVESGACVDFRTPIIPGFTDGEENLRQIAAFLLELGVASIYLLAYHPMGEVKSQRLGWPLESLGVSDRDRARASFVRAIDLMTAAGLTVRHSESH